MFHLAADWEHQQAHLFHLPFRFGTILDISIRNSPTLSSFKNRVKVDTYKTPKYYNECPRKLNILHIRLRHQCSSLNDDLSRIHMIDSDRRPVSNRRPLLKSASTDFIISNHGPILGYSQIGVLSKFSYL